MKKAIILFNVGGPDSLEAVKPFLFNLFSDKNIITLPNPMRFLLAKLISGRRTPVAKEIYRQIGNKSPILEETEKQAVALEKSLNQSGEAVYKVFIAMRYWHPFAYEAVEQVKSFNPDEVILLPLYPQYSTTTTKSSFEDWQKQAQKLGLTVSTKIINDYYEDKDFIRAHVKKIKQYFDKKKNTSEKLRLLFSAHGLPEKIIKAGDPYQVQVEKTADAIVRELAIKNLDWVVCYQSRVGPMKWIGPGTDDEIKRAGHGGCAVMVVPIAFVSEHSETLVELDIEYKHLAAENGVKNYIRVPALGDDVDFIRSLANNVRRVESKQGEKSEAA